MMMLIEKLYQGNYKFRVVKKLYRMALISYSMKVFDTYMALSSNG